MNRQRICNKNLRLFWDNIRIGKHALRIHICCYAILLVQGCANRPDLLTRNYASVATKEVISIGILESHEEYCRNSLVEFFRVDGVEIGFEGGIAFDVLVLREDFDRALAVLGKKWPPPSYCFTPYKWVGRREALKDRESK